MKRVVMGAVRRSGISLVAATVLSCTAWSGPSPTAEESPPAARFAAVEGLELRPGLFPTWVDPEEAKVWLELPAPDPDGVSGRVLYVEGLTTGLGSNPVGLDRGQLGDSVVLEMRRVGGKVLFERPNLAFRAATENDDERRATRESFAPSVLWAAPVEEETSAGTVLIDLTPFLLRDAHGVSDRLRSAGEGEYRLDAERSAVDLDACLSFPSNLEFESRLTYAGQPVGPHVRDTVPDPTSFTLVQHHSFIQLPEDGYEVREFDPRGGAFAIEFRDYAASLEAPVDRRWIVRHRLEVGGEPLVYYVDRGIPEPVRAAVIDGASWWKDAFEAAGFPDAFRVELLPQGVHPLDVRYNVIEWVHRSTRGWSYGGGIIDPRTGEMIKGHVNLGSLRVRQDRLLFEGLGADEPVALALARIRQLAAHEVGHTLGLAHNFAASTYGRASVMDYPAPKVELADDGGLDFSEAYGVGVGEWDRFAIEFTYGERGAGVDGEEVPAGLWSRARDQGLAFLSDADARPAGAAHPAASLWDNGDDPVERLLHELEVRARAIERFGGDALPTGEPLALLEEALTPLYFHHRYQVEAAAKVLGGVEYAYGVQGDGPDRVEVVAGPRQRAALSALLRTLEPEVLELDPDLVARILPRPFGYGHHRELLVGRTAPMFDPAAAAAAAAGHTLEALLQPQRLARLAEQSLRVPGVPSPSEVLDALMDATFDRAGSGPIEDEVRTSVIDRLIWLASSPGLAPPVRAGVEETLETFAQRDGGGVEASLGRRVRRYLDRESVTGEGVSAVALPPGSPIGQEDTFVPGFAENCSWGAAVAPGRSGR